MSNKITTRYAGNGWFYAIAPQGTSQNDLWRAIAFVSRADIPPDPNEAIADIAHKNGDIILSWCVYPTAV